MRSQKELEIFAELIAESVVEKINKRDKILLYIIVVLTWLVTALGFIAYYLIGRLDNTESTLTNIIPYMTQ